MLILPSLSEIIRQFGAPFSILADLDDSTIVYSLNLLER
jgi:hypothetical protein